MFNDIIELVLKSAEGSFLQVTVFVGAVLLLFGFINYKTSGLFVNTIRESKRFQPVIGALLGLTPGCGGAIFIMPLFVKGHVSFGAVVATLVATMGDAAFVLISTMPKQYLVISVLSFIVAVLTGYVVDYLKIGDVLIERMNLKHVDVAVHDSMDHEEIMKESHSQQYFHIGHDEGDPVDIALHHNTKGHQSTDSWGYQFTHQGYKIYWSVIAIGLLLGIMLLFQIDVNALSIPHLGYYLGVGGTVLSIAFMFMSKKFIQDDTHEEEELKIMSLKETLIHNAEETAFVGTWVFVAYLIYEVGIYAFGGADYAAGELMLTEMMLSAGLVSVILGAVIGLIPGCGPQILFVALFTKGMIPFAAVLANAISQDGDALFPLLAIDRKSSFWATVITTIPALFFGIMMYYLEISGLRWVVSLIGM